MALCQFPVNLHTVSSSTSSSFQPRRPQPLPSHVKSNFWIRRLRFHSFNHAIRFNTHELSAIGAAIDIDTHQRKKKKRKPKPGFFEEISDKWSSRISPKNNNFPWQKKQEEQIQHHDEEEEEDESEVKPPMPVDADLLPPMVLGYRCPFRILPQGVKPCQSESTFLSHKPQ